MLTIFVFEHIQLGSMPPKKSLPTNRITLIRLICAGLVLISHLDWIAGNSSDSFRRLGLYAVAIFFGLSGFLLTDSINRNGANTRYVKNRFLRVFPGYFGVLTVTSLVFAPLHHMIESKELRYVFTLENISYIFQNLTTIITQSDINNSLLTSSVPSWNPPLWTLSYELACYIFLFILSKCFKQKYARVINWLLPVCVLSYLLMALSLLSTPPHGSILLYYSSFFLLGSFLYFRPILMSPIFLFVLVPLAMTLAFFPARSKMVFFNPSDFLIGIILIPIALILAFQSKGNGSLKNDYSYGIYIYAAPVTQLLVLSPARIRSNWMLLASLTLFLTFVCAWLSWHLIEKQALRLRT